MISIIQKHDHKHSKDKNNSNTYVNRVNSHLNIHNNKMCCMIGKDIVTATIIDDTTITCPLPSSWLSVFHSFTVSVKVSVNCADFSDSSVNVKKLHYSSKKTLFN